MKKLRELVQMLNEKDPDVCVTVRKYAMISLLEIFKDIIPGYYIRLPTDKEKHQKVSVDLERWMWKGFLTDSLLTVWGLNLIIEEAQWICSHCLIDCLVVECWLWGRDVPGSIPSQGPRYSKDIKKWYQ